VQGEDPIAESFLEEGDHLQGERALEEDLGLFSQSL